MSTSPSHQGQSSERLSSPVALCKYLGFGNVVEKGKWWGNVGGATMFSWTLQLGLLLQLTPQKIFFNLTYSKAPFTSESCFRLLKKS